MKVLFDYQIFTLQKYGGISRYFYELMNNFYQQKDIEIEFPLYFSNNENIKSAKFSNHKTFFPNTSFGLKNNITRKLNKKNIKISSDIIARQNYDLIHPTYYETYFIELLGNKPFVLTIHDMTYEVFPNLFGTNDKTAEYKKFLAAKAGKIITISQNTKKDIIKFYNIEESKIIITPLANSLFPKNIEHLKINLPEKYLLYVGSRKAYKNFGNLLVASKTILNEFNDIFIVCAGGGNFSKEEQYKIKELGLANKVKHFSINDQTLQYFYSNALAFIFPSLYEGFGIPILEAFACKCPVLLSNTSSFPEVAGEAGLYFDPENIESIQGAIKKIITNEKARKELISAGSIKLKEYSWEKTAAQTKLVYESVL